MKGFKLSSCKFAEKDANIECESECGELVEQQEVEGCPEDECCHIPKMKSKCTPSKECVKTYKCCYKLYKFTQYRLFKVCNSCGNEFDHYHHNGKCPKCR